MARILPLLCCAGALAAASAEQGWQWRQTTSPHFEVAHEMAWAPAGFVMGLEKMHNRLRMDLGMFSPWMAKERVKLYLYKDSRSFLAGEFHPPSWSNGLALFALKAVAVPDNPDRKALMRVVSHETTHMLFRGYWQEAGQEPPAWLNEGLAMMEEAESPDKPERSAWFQLMVLAKPDAFMPMDRFFAVSPTQDQLAQEAISNWYVQAYSVVYFLYRGHQRLQFKNFCAELRDGKELSRALWLVYRYHDAAALEKDWRRWLRQPEFRTRVAAALAAAPAEPRPEEGRDARPKDRFAPSRIAPMKGFKSLRE